MREIKFRAFHTGRNCFVPVSAHFDINTEGELYQCDFKPIELMQYTGLKDKNGKEIYEGDICQAENYLVTGELLGSFVGEVFFDEKHLCYDVRCSDPRKLHIPSWKFEVIGNIYESKHLLKKLPPRKTDLTLRDKKG